MNVVALDALNGNVCLYGERTNDAWNKIYYSKPTAGSTWDEITCPGHRFANLTTDVAWWIRRHRVGRVWIGTAERSVGIFTPGTVVITNSVKAGTNLILKCNAGAGQCESDSIPVIA